MVIIEIALTNNRNLSYFGPLHIGNSSVFHCVSFDTAAHEIWIPNDNIQGVRNPYIAANSSSSDNRTCIFFLFLLYVLLLKFLHQETIKLTIFIFIFCKERLQIFKYNPTMI